MNPSIAMKTILRLLACIALPATLHAATWTVDNNTAHPADFREIQEAVDAAAVGDTILITGSTQPYAGFTSTKRLNIKGQGLSAISPGVEISGSIIFTELYDVQSPDHLRNAAGSVLESVSDSSDSGSTIEIYGACSGVTIKRCNTGAINLYGCSGAMIQNCRIKFWLMTHSHTIHNDGRYFQGTGNTIIGTWADEIHFGKPTNTLVENCVLGHYEGGASQTQGPVRTMSSFEDTPPFVLRNTILVGKSSIFYDSDSSSTGNARAVFDHCLSISGSSLPAESGNLSLPYNQFANVFVDATPYTIGSKPPPEVFVLKAGSPALGAGIGGVDLGMYGGLSPFVKDYIPALPRITYLAVPPVVPADTGLTFEVSAEARD